MPSETDEDVDDTEDDVDELARPVRRGRSAKAKKVSPKGKAVVGSKVAKNGWNRQLTSAKKPPSRTYTKKAGDNIANEELADADDSSDLTPVESSEPPSSIVIGDAVVKGEGRKKLEDIKKKFKQVDSWEMEFEDVSQHTLDGELTGDSQKR